MTGKVDVENVNTPGKTARVDAAKYNAMKSAMLMVMAKTAPGDTAKDIKEAAKAHLPEDLFPAGATSGWWVKCVQLDLEAKGVIIRANTKPLRFHLV
ncbi:MAG: DUF6958 family protein [Octadecabacter sp.]